MYHTGFSASHEGGKASQMESVRLEINAHMTSVGEQILCVLEKHTTSGDVCLVKVFVLERLSEAAKFMYGLFQREMEILDTAADGSSMTVDHTAADDQKRGRGRPRKRPVCLPSPELQPATVQPEKRKRGRPRLCRLGVPVVTYSLPLPGGEDEEMRGRPRDSDPTWHPDGGIAEQEMKNSKGKKKTDFLDFEEVPEQQERSSSLVQEESKPTQFKEEADGSTLTSQEVKRVRDGQNRESVPIAGTSNEHVETQADDCGTDPLLSECDTSECDTEDSDDWAETGKGKTQTLEGDNQLSQDDSATPAWSKTGTGGLNCLFCFKMFSKKCDLERHTMIHTGERPFTCTKCGKGFIRKYHLKRHAIIHDDECGERAPVASTSTENMKTRAEVEDRGTPKPTRHCSESDTEEKTQGDDETEPVACKTTPKRSSRGNRSFICSDCGKTFNLKRNLDRHKMIHTGEKPFACTVCGKGFRRMDDQKVHMITHRPASCAVCGDEFSLKSDLTKHMRTTHIERKPTICAVCGKEYTQASSLYKHMEIHTEAKYSICTICGKGYRRLKEHMWIHTGERPFSCTVCGEKYSLKPNLKRHMRTHTGEKPFTCEVCGKGFGRADDIKTHMLTHTGEKPFTCEVCGKGFGRKNKIKIHMRIHTGEKPYTCHICGKSCSQKGDLKRHMRTHTVGDNT